MKTDLFDFVLPERLIAATPPESRDASRMLAVLPSYVPDIRDHRILELPEFLRAGDLIVFNDTRVMPARLIGRRGEARIECLLHKRVAGDLAAWWCFAKPAKKLRAGDVVHFAEDLTGTVRAKHDDGQVMLEFALPEAVFQEKLAVHGQVPLPPYIEKLRKADARDLQRYQTIYARETGSVAAPTAGLHFTERLLAAIEERGVEKAFVTLHVGGGTFLPVKAEDTQGHVMHSELAMLSERTAEQIRTTRARGGRVVAVGTTSMRTLESATDEQGRTHAFHGETAIFITPGYRFRCVDMLLTNFHLPRSTLFMLVCAFSGFERMHRAYAHAIAEEYRFFSYGDACLLERASAL